MTIRPLLVFLMLLPAAARADDSQRVLFTEAWNAASRGDRTAFETATPGLKDYLLYPYLQYEDYRFRRARVPADEMAGFLSAHEGWAFTDGLRRSWFKTLGSRSRWSDLLAYAQDSDDTEVRCYVADAKIRNSQTGDLLVEARDLWTVGQSQPDACDPVFNWLRKQGGITPGLAWERIKRAMDARHPRLILYLARYLDASERVWADRWQQMDRTGYRQLDRAVHWHDVEKARDIAWYGLRRLSRADPDRAEHTWSRLESHFSWDEAERGAVLREIALWSAVEGLEETPERMRAVPEAYRDDRLMEWWVRFDLGRASWSDVIKGVQAMSADLKGDSRWRYWEARARSETGDVELARQMFEQLSGEANFYGFMAADRMGLPYTICPQEPLVEAASIDALAARDGFSRALELRRAGLPAWARAEWKLATSGFEREQLRTAAGLAHREGWLDMTIFALGNSGDLRWYDWRFPLDYQSSVEPRAQAQQLDTSWVLGLMRSESALAADAISSANARGLMQVTPGTARQLSRRHGIPYSGSSQLLEADLNIQFGTAYLRDLLDRFEQNTVLATGAYNAGPHVVDRWLDELETTDPAIWVETLPYYETRDYIPRVLAFATLYDWRMAEASGGPVKRIASRMPSMDPASPLPESASAKVVCSGELR